MQTTGNAGGVRNARIDSSGETFEQLLARMQRGLVVTELMGQGSNTVTGDYSRGAAGFWVEDGQIAYPVAEITVAGNLRQMFEGLLAVGCDNDIPGAVDTGSWLIERMTVAGN
jgi:PmbA protein